ncbi:hypothetical protein [Halorhodospira halochloris]|uniref:hypothetical protein n=1 Tax=Halorhodospira halochloris TaxID=1052 RepID=UPI001EE90BF9|nr:hypothetical protein [Halorhodospira halochloris]MCG5547529.1 hypothetical protein [Halorhodospira halochloris]
MFIRMQKRTNASNESRYVFYLVESKRNESRQPRQRYIAYLGTLPDKHTRSVWDDFLAQANEALDQCNELDEDSRQKLKKQLKNKTPFNPQHSVSEDIRKAQAKRKEQNSS